MTLNGYDISAYQGTLDIAAVPADFVHIKATGGDGYVNPSFRAQVAQAKACGRLVSIYHFARDGYTSATAHSEAQWFIKQAGDLLDGTVVAVLDWEGDNVGDVAYAKAWLDEVTAATGVKPLLYASYATVTDYDWSSVAGANYGLWESAYVLGYQQINGFNPPAGLAPIPYWGAPAEWQYTSSGRIPGWPADLDLDVFFGDAAAWAAYAAKNGQVAPTTTTVTPLGDDVSYSQWSPADKIALYCDIWGLNGGLAGAPLVPNLRLGHGEWPYTLLGANEQRIENELLPAAAVAPVNAHTDSAVKAIPTVQAASGGTTSLTAADIDAIATAVLAKYKAQVDKP